MAGWALSLMMVEVRLALLECLILSTVLGQGSCGSLWVAMFCVRRGIPWVVEAGMMIVVGMTAMRFETRSGCDLQLFVAGQCLYTGDCWTEVKLTCCEWFCGLGEAKKVSDRRQSWRRQRTQKRHCWLYDRHIGK